MSRRSAAIAIAMGFWLMAGAPAIADGESEFLAGRSKACVNCALPAASFKRKDLANADLTGANLAGAVFHRARLLRVKLDGANLSNANLNKTDLKGATLTRAKLEEAKLFERDPSGPD